MEEEILKAIENDFRNEYGEFRKVRSYFISDFKDINLEEGIKFAYNELDKRNRDIVSQRLYEKLTFKEIGKLNGGITTARARELFRKSLRRMIRHIVNYSKFSESNDVESVFSTRTGHILVRNGYNTVKDLEGISYLKFMKFSNAGQISWNELRSYMDMNNIPYSDIEFDYVDILGSYVRKTERIISKYKINQDIADKYQEEIQDHIVCIINILLDMFGKSREGEK